MNAPGPILRGPSPFASMRLADLARFDRRRVRDDAQAFLVEGVRSVESAVEAGARLLAVFATDEAAAAPRVAALLAGAERGGARVSAATVRDLARVSETETSQGVVAVAAMPPEPDLSRAHRVLVLDGVQDPGNVGTLVRTAAWFGLDAVVAGPGTADLFAPKVVRSAMGGLWDVGLMRSADLAATLDALRTVGLRLYGAALDGEDAAAWRPEGRVALVLGSEAHGLSAATTAALDGAVTLAGSPHRRGAESLNVAVAGGVLLWAMAR